VFSALLNELNQELVIGITFTVVFAALLLVERSRPRKTMRDAKSDGKEAQVSAPEEAAIQQMKNQVKLAFETAYKKQAG
jgi:hypothetical protein